jgi:hypothetical protein
LVAYLVTLELDAEFLHTTQDADEIRACYPPLARKLYGQSKRRLEVEGRSLK